MIEKSRLISEYGRPKLYDLFIEDNPTGPYTYAPLDSQDGAISLYRLFMEEEDLTEWSFANKHLLGWDHWEKLQNVRLLRPIVESWRRDLEQKLKSRAFKEIQLIASEGGKNSFEANKIILNGKWKELVQSVAASRGRPGKQEVDKKLQEELDLHKQVNEDLKRMGLN